jgi:outer membrane protein assembly factor BamB
MYRFASIVLASLAIAGAPGPAAAWNMVRGDAANTGLARVVTEPAANWPSAIQETGALGWDAGPVTADDGTVYLATLAGELHAFAHDGTPRWRLGFGTGLWAEASPAVSADGSIYVVVRRIDRDAAGESHVQMLHKYSPTGLMLWRRQLPSRLNPYLKLDQGSAHSAPKLWRHGDVEVVMLGVVHGIRRAEAATMIAISGATGDLLQNLPLGHDPDNHDLTGSSPLSDAIEAVLSKIFVGFSLKIPCD